MVCRSQPQADNGSQEEESENTEISASDIRVYWQDTLEYTTHRAERRLLVLSESIFLPTHCECIANCGMKPAPSLRLGDSHEECTRYLDTIPAARKTREEPCVPCRPWMHFPEIVGPRNNFLALGSPLMLMWEVGLGEGEW